MLCELKSPVNSRGEGSWLKNMTAVHGQRYLEHSLQCSSSPSGMADIQLHNILMSTAYCITYTKSNNYLTQLMWLLRCLSHLCDPLLPLPTIQTSSSDILTFTMCPSAPCWVISHATVCSSCTVLGPCMTYINGPMSITKRFQLPLMSFIISNWLNQLNSLQSYWIKLLISYELWRRVDRDGLDMRNL